MNLAILDTDMLAEVFKRRDPVVSHRAADYLAARGKLTFSAMTRFEVLRGLREKQSARLIERFEVL